MMLVVVVVCYAVGAVVWAGYMHQYVVLGFVVLIVGILGVIGFVYMFAYGCTEIDTRWTKWQADRLNK